MELREDDPSAHKSPLEDINSPESRRRYLKSLERERDEVQKMYELNELGHGEFAYMMSNLDQLLYGARNAVADAERHCRGDKLSLRRKIGHFFFGR